ncbi:Bax inhibitor-1/YccA family protein [bacterium]|nr:Bax inhibitor-1/YccA family protein [bacterium]
MFRRSSNPMFRNSVMEATYNTIAEPMTVSGTVNKLIILALIMFVGAYVVYHQITLEHADTVMKLMMTGCIGGLITVFVIAFKKEWADYLAPVYAFLQGMVIYGISFFTEVAYPGIVTQAIVLTMGTVLVMGLLYKAKVIRATEKFRSTLLIATLTVGAFYLIGFVLMFFHINIPYFSDNPSVVNIALNCFIVLIASFNLILDFDFIERGAQMMYPKYFEMYGAFGLLVTILWMYIEILRLLSRLRNR